jgi:hypothetical protein
MHPPATIFTCSGRKLRFDPAPATRKTFDNKVLNAERFAPQHISAKQLDATSTFDQPASFQAGFLRFTP